MKTKTDKLNILFDEWEQSIMEYKGRFVRDGIIDETLYLSASKKILYIAKEPNNPNQQAYDFREWWRGEIKYAFSIRIAEWSYGLLNDFPQYDDIWKNKEVVQEALLSIAFMNIKKIGGGPISEYRRMMEHVKKNYMFLQKEIEIISPEIIITGTTWLELRKELFPNIEWKNSGYDIAIGRHLNAKVIDFYHPSSRNAPAAAYSLLQNVINSEKFKFL